MTTIEVALDKPYPIYCGNGILNELADILPKHTQSKQIAVISSSPIYDLYGEQLVQALPEEAKIRVFLVPDGETAKTLQQVEALYTKLLENHFERGSLVIALGGGVVGDLAGFVAATYLRGVDFVQVSTSLLAQVDSSIGGKTGVNHPLGKNLIGAFKQPLFVLADTATLQTLPEGELRNGLGEVIKYGFILNADFFTYLESHLEQALAKDADVLQKIVEISAGEKARVVAEDETEKGLRMILNFGHTFGHALEKEFGFGELKHGEAVILGMRCALQFAFNEGVLTEKALLRGQALLKQVPVKYASEQIEPETLSAHMLLDKKVKDGKIRLVLIEEIGKYKIWEQASEAAIKKAWETLR